MHDARGASLGEGVVCPHSEKEMEEGCILGDAACMHGVQASDVCGALILVNWRTAPRGMQQRLVQRCSVWAARGHDKEDDYVIDVS